MNDLFRKYDPALLDHLLNLIFDGSETDDQVSETYLLEQVVDEIPDRIALMLLLSDIEKFDSYLIEKGTFVAGKGHYYYAGKKLQEFLETGGFQGIINRDKDKRAKLDEQEKLEFENLQTSIASGKAAIESEKHSKSSKYAAWVASLIAILAILASIGIAWWQGAQNDDLKRRIEVLEKQRPIHDTLIIKDTLFIEDKGLSS